MVASIAPVLVGLTLAGPIHCVSDISHEFTFYMDGRFSRQYLQPGDVDVRNWGTLHKQDLTNVNLLVLSSGDTRVPYSKATVEHIKRYVADGGGLLLMSSAQGLPESRTLPLQSVGDVFGVTWERNAAQPPIQIVPIGGPKTLEFAGGGTLSTRGAWTTLATDSAGKTVLAQRMFGRGKVLAASRGLFGSRPDAGDPINQAWMRTLLRELARGKEVDASRPPKGNFAELSKQVGPLTLEFTEGTQQFADSIAKEYSVVKPLLTEITGVDPAPGMITRMLMLPTGGGGFSSGERIAIGAWWGDYPNRRYPMIELISHEAGHSWVLPHAEPVWNEPIATYLGILVGRRLGMKEADETLQRTIEGAKRDDPGLDKVDIGQPGAPGNVVWGKAFFLFEELERLHGPGSMAKYFRAKRRLVPASRRGYSLDDCVAVWSVAVDKDLFPWFRSLGIQVDRSKTDLAIPQKAGP